MVEYLHEVYPDAIHHATINGDYPIHCAIVSTKHSDNPYTGVKVVQFLLNCDPNQLRGKSLLHFACQMQYNDSNIEAGIQVIKIFFDTHPEAIEDNTISMDIQHYHQRIQSFINGELVYARQAKDHRLITTLDDNGQLPLHTALQNNASLGSIKLLVKGNSDAIQSPDNNGALPLHVACQHHDSTSVVQYLLCLDEAALNYVDMDNNTVLHCACRGAKHEPIALLLDKYDAASVSKKNADGKLPIDLLWESNKVSDRESLEYTGSVFQLMRANPQMVQSVIR